MGKQSNEKVLTLYFDEIEYEFIDKKEESEFFSYLWSLRSIQIDDEWLSDEIVRKIVVQSEKERLNNVKRKVYDLGGSGGSDLQKINEHMLKSSMTFVLPCDKFDYTKFCLVPSQVFYCINDDIINTDNYYPLMDEDKLWSEHRIIYDGQQFESYDYEGRGIYCEEIWNRNYEDDEDEE